MKAFQYSSRAQRIVFGTGTIQQIGKEIDALGVSSVLVLSTPDQRRLAEHVVHLLGARATGLFDRAVMHVPIETARAACAMAFELGADSVVAIGGGSTIGLAKAIALEMGLPVLAIPTTYAGSEMTAIYGLTDGGLKRTGTDVRVLPRTVIYDPVLTYSLPVAVSVTSGINALAHAVEGLYAHDRNPISDLMAREGIRALAAALPLLVTERDTAVLTRCNAGCYSLSELGQRNLWRIDSIPHLPLLAKVAGRIADGRVLEGSATQDAIRWTRGKKTSLNARCLPFPIQAGVTCAVASAIASMQFVAQGTFVSHWLRAYFFSWVAMLPVVIVAAPFIRWLANRITR